MSSFFIPVVFWLISVEEKVRLQTFLSSLFLVTFVVCPVACGRLLAWTVLVGCWSGLVRRASRRVFVYLLSLARCRDFSFATPRCSPNQPSPASSLLKVVTELGVVEISEEENVRRRAFCFPLNLGESTWKKRFVVEPYRSR